MKNHDNARSIKTLGQAFVFWAACSSLTVSFLLAAHFYYSSRPELGIQGALVIGQLFFIFYFCVFIPVAVVFTAAIISFEKITKKDTAPLIRTLAAGSDLALGFYVCERIAAASSHFPPGIMGTVLVGLAPAAVFFALWRFPVIGGEMRGKPAVFGLAPAIALAAVSIISLRYNASSTPANSISDLAPQIRSAYQPTGQRLAVIGIDGATWNVINPLMERGDLPNLRKLVSEGARADMETIFPTLSPLIWTSIATGVTPDEHGIRNLVATKIPGMDRAVVLAFPTNIGVSAFNTFYRRLHLHAPLTAFHRGRPALWDIMTVVDRPCAMLNWWPSHPAYPVRGAMVSRNSYFFQIKKLSSNEPAGFSAPANLTFPADLQNSLTPLLRLPRTLGMNDYKRFMNIEDGDAARMRKAPRGDEAAYLFKEFHHFYTNDAYYVEAAKAVIERRDQPLDLMMCYLRGVDLASHRSMRYSTLLNKYDPERPGMKMFGQFIENYYKYTDELIGRLLARLGEDCTVMVVSDHGFELEGPYHWDHHYSPPGVFIIKGPMVRPGAKLLQVSIYDVAPTGLHLLGLPAARDMPGRAVIEAFSPEWQSRHPVRFIDSYGSRRLAEAPGGQAPGMDELDREDIERLRALGYIQ